MKDAVNYIFLLTKKHEKRSSGMNKYKETTRSDSVRTLIYISIFLGVVVIGAVFLAPVNPPAGAVWIILSAGALFLLVRWHALTFEYQCAKCGHEFEISVFVDLFSLQGIYWKYLKCPNCRQWSRAGVIRNMET